MNITWGRVVLVGGGRATASQTAWRSVGRCAGTVSIFLDLNRFDAVLLPRLEKGRLLGARGVAARFLVRVDWHRGPIAKIHAGECLASKDHTRI